MARAALKTAAWKRHVPRVTASVLAILIGLDLAHFCRDIEHSRDLIFRPSQASAPPSRAGLASEDDAHRIASAHLFGAAEIVAHRERPGANDIRSTLVLTGVIAMKEPETGFAMLGKKGDATQLYRAGAALSDSAGVRLYQVFADRVVLATGGGYETLRLPRSFAIGARPDITSRQTAAAWGASAAQEIPFKPATVAETLFANLDAVEDREDGKLAGMRVHPPTYLRRLYGIEDGDVVTAVNGVAITSRDVLTHSLRGSGAAVTLTVVRDGVEQTLSMPVSN